MDKQHALAHYRQVLQEARAMRSDLEIAMNQLKQYLPEPAGTSPLMDQVAALWNRSVEGRCVVCGGPTEQGMNYCPPHFAEVEADQDAIAERAKELEKELYAPDPTEEQGFELDSYLEDLADRGRER